jgi:tRNA nucleotidyltransferase (CCA-adding enzyme)
LLRSYEAFLTQLTKLDILDVENFKPLLKGTDLAKVLNTKPGPWMKDALDVVMAWQLRNPGSTDSAAAIEAVKASGHEQTNSELPLRLASHFLQLTIPPFFPQNNPALNTLEASRLPAPWKDPTARYALDLLAWTITVLGRKEIEAKWHLLAPPTLKMIDDMDAEWKAQGCRLLNLLLERLREPSTNMLPKSKATTNQHPSSFLHRTGYHNVFADTLLPLFTYIPSLTPEPEAVVLFRELFPALTSLALLLPTEISKGDTRIRFLDKILRQGILAPLAHFPTPSTYPELATVILSHLQVLLGHLGVESVKHLPNVTPLLSIILQEPFILGHKPLALSTLNALQAVMLNAWPRIPAHRGAIMMGLCLCWSRCVEEQKTLDEHDTGAVRKQLRETAAMLDAVMQAVEEEGMPEVWEKEKREVMEASSIYAGLFEDSDSNQV